MVTRTGSRKVRAPSERQLYFMVNNVDEEEQEADESKEIPTVVFLRIDVKKLV